MAEDPLIESVIDGRYRVLSKLGEGGMGAVYRAEHTALRKVYALKVLRLQSNDAEAVGRFDREARAAAHLEHRNIARCHHVGMLPDGGRFLVMDLVEGESLANLLARERRLEPARALPVLSQVAQALACAHDKQIVHRDLKPDNVVIGHDGVVKLIDFGIARAKSGALGGGATALTKAGTMLGTPAYMPPEQVVGQTVDARADQYAFGVIAFEMLTGTAPFSAEDPLSLVFKHVGEAIPRASEREPSLPPAVDAVFDRVMAKMPEERFVTMREAYEAFDAALTGRASMVAVAPRVTQPALAAPVVAGASVPRVTQPGLVAPAAAVAAGAAVASVPRESIAHAKTVIGPAVVSAPPSEGRGGHRAAVIVAAAAVFALLLMTGGALVLRGRGTDERGSTEAPRVDTVGSSDRATQPPVTPTAFTGVDQRERDREDEREDDEDEREDEERGGPFGKRGRGHGHGHGKRH